MTTHDGILDAVTKHPATEPNAAESTVQRQFYATSAPSLSHTGRHIAYLYDDGSGYTAAYQRVVPQVGQDPLPPRPVTLPIEGPVTAVQYSPDGKYLALQVSPFARGRNEVWVVANDPDDERAWRVSLDTDVDAELVGWKDDCVTLTALTETAHGADYDSITRAVHPETGASDILDEQHNAVLLDAVGPSDSGAVLLRCGNRGQRYAVLRYGGRDYELLLRAHDTSTEGGQFIMAQTHFGAPGEPSRLTVVLQTEYGAEAMRLLQVTLDIAADGNTHQITTAELAARSDNEVDDFAISYDGKVVAVAWNNHGYSDVEVISVATGTGRSLNIPHSTVASTPSLSADGSQLALTVESSDFAPHILLCNTVSGRCVPLDPRGPDQIATTLPQRHTFHARDGLPLDGWWYPPINTSDELVDGDTAQAQDAEPRGVILWFHGGPEWESRPTFQHIFPILRHAGFGVFAPNVRGSTGHGRVFNHLDDVDKRFDSWTDMQDCAHYARAHLPGGQHLIMSGRSYGGYLTHVAVAKYPGLFDAAIAVCGMSDLGTFFETTEPWMAQRSYTKYGQPGVDDDLLSRLSPVRHVAGATTPLLCVHGAEDNNVSPQESRQMVEALTELGVDSELLLLEGEGHEISTWAGNIALAEAMIDWIDTH